MSGYPEDMPARGVCIAEGCKWAGGSVCVRCGERLRCACGQYVREDSFDRHFIWCPLTDRSCKVCGAVTHDTGEHLNPGEYVPA